MPAVLGIKFKFPQVSGVQPAWLVGGVAVVVFGVGGILLGSTSTAVAGGTVRPLYPAHQSPVEVTDVPNLTVVDVVKELPMGLRFSLLLGNSGVLQELAGQGPYTLFVPADNYFDYLPRGAYVSLNKSELMSLALAHVVSGEVQLSDALSSNYIIVKAYKAKNGMVYVINKILVPYELTSKLMP